MTLPPPPPPPGPPPGPPLGPAPGADPGGIGKLPALVGRWIVHNVPRVALMAAIGFGAGWLLNIWLMANAGGTDDVPVGGTSTAPNNVALGMLLWGLISGIVFGGISYARAVGRERFVAEVRNLPRLAAQAFERDGAGATASVLFGVAVGIALTGVVGPYVAATLSVGLLVSAQSYLGRLFSGLATTVASGSMRAAGGRAIRRSPPGAIGVLFGAGGSAAAALYGYLLPRVTQGLNDGAGLDYAGRLAVSAGVALVLGAVALVLARQPRVTPGMGLLAVALAVAGLQVLAVHQALADDGGAAECEGQFYLTCDGAKVVIGAAAAGGAAAGAGAAVGAGLGGVLAGLPGAAGAGAAAGAGSAAGGAAGGATGAPGQTSGAGGGPEPGGGEGGEAGGGQPGGGGGGEDTEPFTAGDEGGEPEGEEPGVGGEEGGGEPPPEQEPEGGTEPGGGPFGEGTASWTDDDGSRTDVVLTPDGRITTTVTHPDGSTTVTHDWQTGAGPDGYGEPAGPGLPGDEYPEPGEPSEGAEPAEPGEGAEPTGPGEGAEPGEGQEPGEPGEGAEPTEPSEGSEPGEPGEGEEPTEGEEPGEGGEPGEGEVAQGAQPGEGEGEGQGQGEGAEGEEGEGATGEPPEGRAPPDLPPPEIGAEGEEDETEIGGRYRQPAGEQPDTRLEDAQREAYEDRFNDSRHTVDPNAQAVMVDDEGRPMVDDQGNPRVLVDADGRPLPVDTEGRVRYGDTWMDPAEATQRAGLDTESRAVQQNAQRMVDEFRDLVARANANPGDQALQDQVRARALEIGESIAAKSILKDDFAKAGGPTDATRAFNTAVGESRVAVDRATVDGLNDLGVRRGVDAEGNPKPFTTQDLGDIRNKSSMGTGGLAEEKPPMDRDVGLNEDRIVEARRQAGEATRAVSDLEAQLRQATPGSPEAQRIQGELETARDRAQAATQEVLDARRAGQITIDYDKALETTRSQLAAATPGSPEAERLTRQLGALEDHASRTKQTYLDGLENKIAAAPEGSPERAALTAELEAARGRAAGQAGQVPISEQRWNDLAQKVYENSFERVTGRDPERSLQAVTQAGNAEAYRDRAVLANDPAKTPFSPLDAEQTGSVTAQKAHVLQELAEKGTVSRPEAAQEIARGTAKDEATKLLNQLRNDPRADPAAIERLTRVQQVLERAGSGQIPAGQIDLELQRATGNPDMTLSKAVGQVEANLTAATKWQGGEASKPGFLSMEARPGFHSAMGTASDLATLNQYTQENLAKGMGAGEAMAVAGAQTAAGNAVMAAPGVNPLASMVGGAVAPEQLRGALPDRFAENAVGTGYETGKATLQDLHESLRTGELRTENLDRVAENVVNRPGADPFKGYGLAAQEAGSFYENPGQYIEDVRQVIVTGAGAEQLNQSMSEFQAEVAAGKHGPALQGVDHLVRIGADLAVDPKTTVGEFLDDVKTIYENGVGDGYWSEAAAQTYDVAKGVPVVGTALQGYEEIYKGVQERGIGGFTSDMAEGAWEMTRSGAEGIRDGAVGAYDWVRSWF